MELAIHIGYAKSATTYLQTKFFNKIKGVNYIGRYYGENIPKEKMLTWVYDFVFEKDFNASAYKDEILKNCRRDEINLLSHEVFLRPNYEWVILKRLKKLSGFFSNIKIIFSIRNQIEIILSRYMHDLNGFAEKYDFVDALDFEGTISCSWPVCHDIQKLTNSKKECICKKLGRKVINVPHYDYLKLWCLSNSLFDAKNVHVIVSENLRSNPDVEFRNFCNFLGVKAQNTLWVKIDSELVHSRSKQPKYKELKERVLETEKYFEIQNYFKNSNLVLSNLMKNNLLEFGYL